MKRESRAFPLAFSGAVMALVGTLAVSGRFRPAFGGADGGYGATALSAWGFLASFAAVTAVVIMLARGRLGSKVFSCLFALAVLVGAAAIGSSLAGAEGAVVAFSAAILLRYGSGRVWSFDLALAVGLSGVALHFGRALSPPSAAVILSVLSLYDVWAVYGSRHMAEMAERLSANRADFALLIPLRCSALGQKVGEIRPAGSVFRLGTGDIALPAVMAVSAAGSGWGSGLAVLAGSAVGLAVSLMVFFRQDRPHPIPALPAPAAGALLAYLLSETFAYLCSI